jgi:hypothetical protein
MPDQYCAKLKIPVFSALHQERQTGIFFTQI